MTSHVDPSGSESMRASDVRFFWIEGPGAGDDRWYHWAPDCPFITVAVWHGADLVSSATPPPGAADAESVRKTLVEHLPGPAWDPGLADAPGSGTTRKRWLCKVCSQFHPRTEALPTPAIDEPCEKCRCPRELHVIARGPFDHGCAMAWADVYDPGGPNEQVGLIHCRCDGYAPTPGGRPLTVAEVWLANPASGLPTA